MAAGRRRPKVSQAGLERKPGAMSWMEESNSRKRPKTSQMIPLAKRRSKGFRQEASISAARSRFSGSEETMAERSEVSGDGEGAFMGAVSSLVHVRFLGHFWGRRECSIGAGDEVGAGHSGILILADGQLHGISNREADELFGLILPAVIVQGVR